MLSVVKEKHTKKLTLLEIVFIKTSLSVYIFGKQNTLYIRGYKMQSFTAKSYENQQKIQNNVLIFTNIMIVLHFRMKCKS